jgi:hypothetical protein
MKCRVVICRAWPDCWWYIVTRIVFLVRCNLCKAELIRMTDDVVPGPDHLCMEMRFQLDPTWFTITNYSFRLLISSIHTLTVSDCSLYSSTFTKWFGCMLFCHEGETQWRVKLQRSSYCLLQPYSLLVNSDNSECDFSQAKNYQETGGNYKISLYNVHGTAWPFARDTDDENTSFKSPFKTEFIDTI